MAVGAIKRGKRAGWNPRVGRSSRSEAPLERNVLEQWPCAEGLLLERHGGAPNYAFHGQALIVLRALSLSNTRQEIGRSWQPCSESRERACLLRQSTVKTTRLQAWSWIEGTSVGLSQRRSVCSR